jgi:hypothetical protein
VARPQQLVGLKGQRAKEIGPAGARNDRHNPPGRVTELGRARSSRDRRLFEGISADRDLGPCRPEEAVAPVAGLDRYPIDVCRVLGLARAPDAEAAVGIFEHPRLKHQNLVEIVDGQRFGKVAVHSLLGCHFVARHQRLGLAYDGDLLEFDRRLLQLHVHRAGLASQHLYTVDLGRFEADERHADRDGPSRHVVDEVISLRVGMCVERGSHDEDLGIGDRRTVRIAHSAFDLASRALGEQGARLPHQHDADEGHESRSVCNCAAATLLHGCVLEVCGSPATSAMAGR